MDTSDDEMEQIRNCNVEDSDDNDEIANDNALQQFHKERQQQLDLWCELQRRKLPELET